MKVSVLTITYNHEEFIAQAIDSFLMQQVNFDYEIVIGEDCSTDNTRDIVVNYQKKYPDKIRALLPEKNLGMQKNFLQTLKACQGKYIALCEGDDYWTDPLKLQKQVDFLEANSDFALCFHNANIINEDYPDRNRLNNNSTTPEVTTLNDLLKGVNYISTLSVVIRANLIQDLPDWFNSSPFGDYALYLIVAHYGKIKYINEVMGTYRMHQGGVHGGLFNSAEGLTRAFQQHYDFWKVIKQSGIISGPEPTQHALRAIENVIDNAAKSQQTKIFLQYNYLLLLQSHGRAWRQVSRRIIEFCRCSMRKVRDLVLENLALVPLRRK